MNTVITFYIVRHGKTLMNTLDRVQGWCDSPLTQQGIEIAEALGKGMQDIRFDSVYTSDLKRTYHTAQIILRSKGQEGLPVTEMEELREACFGGYESDRNKRMWREAALYLHYANPEGMYRDAFNGTLSNKEILNAISELDTMGLAENFGQVEKRTQEALFRIAEKESEKGENSTILLVSHGMSIIAMLQNLGAKELLKSHLENAAVCKVTYCAGKFKVSSMGDMSYVEKGYELLNK